MKKRLIAEGPRFTFAQALRLLRACLIAESGGTLAPAGLDRRIRIHPELSLSYPESDITRIEEIPGDEPRYLFETTFLGLYGASSPLPTFYTEDLLHERADESSVCRDFLDILNTPPYRLYFGIWRKYRLFHCLVEQPDPDTLNRLFALAGLESPVFRERVDAPSGSARAETRAGYAYSLLRYIGLLTHFPRSASGLRSLLSDQFAEPTFRVEQCVARVAPIPREQRCFLGISGNGLGENACLGMEMLDRMGRFRIGIGPSGSETFHRFLPDRPDFGWMARLIRFYLAAPLEWDMEFVLRARDIKPARLGNPRWSQLGWNTWIFSGDAPMDAERTAGTARREKKPDGLVSITVTPPHTERGN